MLPRLLILLLALMPGMALASDLRPAEEPPGDFTSRQYIDSRGCVFLREGDGDGAGWRVRVARDGAPICGYPPTFSARGVGGRPRLRALDPNAGRSRAQMLEQVLSETVLTNLQPGELASDPRPLETLPDMGPEPASKAPFRALQSALAAAPAVQQGMGEALQPNRRLCRLLGYDGGSAPDTTGRDPSKGYCGSLPKEDLSRLSFVRPLSDIRKADPAQSDAPAAASDSTDPAAPVQRKAETARTDAAKPAAGASVAKAKPAVVSRRPVRKAAAKPVAGTKPKAAAAPDAAKNTRKRAGRREGLIPAGARYVQLGTYAQPENARRAAERVVRLGYPVLRGRDKVDGREVQFLLAGPFKDREAIVRALDGIRRAGFHDAYPR